MNRTLVGGAGSIMVATDSTSDAALVKGMLEREFTTVETTTDPDSAVADVEQHAPQVLILAFNRVENSERFCLGLFRRSAGITAHSLRTILLCSKEEVRRAYQLCQQRLFDDYVLFWPMTHDTYRLPMAVHLALRELRAGAGAGAAEYGALTRRLAELETLLDEQFTDGGQHLEAVGAVVGQAERDLLAALDRFSVRLDEGALAGDAMAGARAEVTREFASLKAGQWRAPLQRAGAPLAEWVDRFRQQLQPHLEALRVHGRPAAAPPLVLIVDDDALQRKLLATILKNQGYRFEFAASATQAFNLLCSVQPDLILMDLMMPDMDGMAATRQIRMAPLFAGIPIIMITGNSGGNVVLDSLKSGATDFVVKPVEPEKLIAKIAAALRTP